MDKYLKIKRKSLDDDLDDSFDFFLPNKLKEKSILNLSNGKSQKIITKKKKFSPSSSNSSLSQESFDTDVDRAMSICFSKTECNEFSAISNVRNKESSGHWKELTTKMKPRHPLLLKRTAAEREEILSQKLALILVNDEEKSGSDNFSLINMEDIIQSNVLFEQWCKTCSLWSAARKPPEKVKEFYITSFINYVEFDINEEQENYLTQKSGIIPNSFEKTEDLGNDDDEEEAGFPLTQNIIEEVDNNKSSVDIFENCYIEEATDSNVKSCENSLAESDKTKFEDNCQINNSLINSTLVGNDEERKVVSESPDIVILSSPTSSNRTVPLPTNYSYSQKTISPAHSFNSASTENWNSKVGMLDRIGLTLLSEDWNNLFETNSGDITVLLDSEETLSVHKFILTVRCQSLISEITDDNKLTWKIYSLDVGKSFFRYVYTGKCDHLWNLTSFEKNTIKRLARIYHLSHLEEVLNQFHRSRKLSNSPDLKLKTILEKYDKIKSKSFDRLSMIMESNDNYGMTISKSPESSFYVSKTPQIYSASLEHKDSKNEGKQSFTYEENHCAKNFTGESIEISSSSDKEDVNQYDYNYPCPSSPLQDIQSPQDVSYNTQNHIPVRKSLEAFFQDSFPEIPSDGLTSFTNNSNNSQSNILEQNTQNSYKSLSDETSDNESDNLSFQASFISSSINDSPEKLPRSSPIDNRISYSLPSTSTALSPNKITLLQNTPSTSRSDIIFSKNATPFPNYDEMITPQLKKELKKFGLKSDLRSAKAKLILKYIYDQTHPVIESSGLLEKEVSTDDLPTVDSDKSGTLEEMVSKLVKSNEELYNHILQFKPIWLEQFYNLLKENGIRCTINDLKDALNKLCITYRANNTRNASKKSTRKKVRNKNPAKVRL